MTKKALRGAFHLWGGRHSESITLGAKRLCLNNYNHRNKLSVELRVLSVWKNNGKLTNTYYMDFSYYYFTLIFLYSSFS